MLEYFNLNFVQKIKQEKTIEEFKLDAECPRFRDCN